MVSTGDYIPFELKFGEEVAVRAMHDRTGHLFFVLEYCLWDKHRINPTDDNVGGWQTCEMRNYLNENEYVFTLLPDGLQKAIVQTEIAESGPRGSETTSKDKLFLLSLEQVCGADFDQLDWFEEKRHLIKLDGECEPSDWWLRSAGAKNLFAGVSSSGNPTIYDIDDIDTLMGVVFGFCLTD